MYIGFFFCMIILGWSSKPGCRNLPLLNVNPTQKHGIRLRWWGRRWMCHELSFSCYHWRRKTPVSKHHDVPMKEEFSGTTRLSLINRLGCGDHAAHTMSNLSPYIHYLPMNQHSHQTWCTSEFCRPFDWPFKFWRPNDYIQPSGFEQLWILQKCVPHDKMITSFDEVGHEEIFPALG